MLIQRTPLNVQKKKFIKRFQYLESKAGDLGKPLMDMTLQKWIFFGKKQKL
jgi:XTP/dITP diphosphohydrolase